MEEKSYPDEVARKWKKERDRYRAALERIVSMDFRGNEPMEQRIAREALIEEKCS